MPLSISSSDILISGINPDLQFVFLIIPVIAMYYVFLKYIIGVNVFNLEGFLLMIFTILMFNNELELFAKILQVCVFLTFTFFSVYYIKKFFLQIELHYYTRLSLLVSFFSLSILSLIFVATYNDNIVDFLKLNNLNSFSIFFVVLLAYLFNKNQTSRGFRKSRKVFITSMIACFIIAGILSISGVQLFILNFPFISIVAVVLIFLIGRYRGLRLIELIRFNALLEEKND